MTNPRPTPEDRAVSASDSILRWAYLVAGYGDATPSQIIAAEIRSAVNDALEEAAATLEPVDAILVVDGLEENQLVARAVLRRAAAEVRALKLGERETSGEA